MVLLSVRIAGLFVYSLPEHVRPFFPSFLNFAL
nr:MAG TPA: hypothetical protein [Caudoviricetes sp.]